MSTNQELPTLEETLEKTDFGRIINENKKLIMILSAVTVVAVIIYSVFGHMQSSKDLAKLDRAYEVEQEVFTSFISDKTKADDFVRSLSSIEMDLVGHPNLVPALVEAVNKLDEQSKVNETVISTVQKWQKHLSKSSFLNLFLSVRLAALYEDAGKTDEAVTLLESLVSFKSRVFKEKIHFDLGRLYLAKGDKTKATERFNFILADDGKNGPMEYKALAKLYLEEL